MKSSRRSTRSSLVRFYVATLRDRHIDICHNLRPSPEGGGLCAIRRPVRLDIPSMPGARLLPGGVRRVGGKTILFIEYQGSLLCLDAESRKYHTLSSSSSGIPCAVLSTSSGLIVMMGEGCPPMRLSFTGGVWSWRSPAGFPAPLAVIRSDEDTISVRIPAGHLRGVYDSRSRRLTPDDALTLRKALIGAYHSAGNIAAARRLYFQPVMARYRLRGHDGSVLYVSPPVIVAPPSGLQLTGAEFTLSGDGFADFADVTLTVRAFSLSLRRVAPLGEEWRGLVKCAELLVSPQLHPLDESLEGDAVFGRFTSSSVTLSVSLPGVNPSVARAAPGSALRAQAEALLSHSDEALSPVASARYDPESDTWAGAVRPFYTSGADTASGLKALRRILDLPVAESGSDAAVMGAIAPPHSLNAGLTATSGNCVALGDLSVTRFPGWLPAEFAVTADEGTYAVPMACKVIFSDGSSSVRSDICRDFSPDTLSPLLVYPSGDAVGLELYWEKHSLRLSLTPDPSGRFSYWLDDSGIPAGAVDNMPSFILPSASPAPRRFPGLVAVTSVSAPLNPLAVTRIADDSPVGLAAAPSQSGAWDAGSTRFYLFGAEGTQSLTVNASRSRLTARTLDSRPVDSADAVCQMGSRGIALLAGGDLLRLSGQRVSTIRPFTGAGSLGWNPAQGELYCFHSADSPCPENFTLYEGRGIRPLFPDAIVVRPDTGDVSSRSCPVPESLVSSSLGLWAVDGEGNILDFCSEDPEAETEVIFRSSVSLSDTAAGRRYVAIPLYGDIKSGLVELRADNGSGPAASDTLSSWEVSGEITHLPPCELLTPHRHSLILSLRASAGSIQIRQNQ